MDRHVEVVRNDVSGGKCNVPEALRELKGYPQGW